MVSVALDDLEVTKGQDVLSLYEWNTKIAKHYFCSKCGIYTHHQRRRVPTEYSFNIGCIDEIDTSVAIGAPTADGASQTTVSS